MRPLLRPAALASHVVVLAVVAALVGLGQWQFQRLEERREQNDRLEQRLAAPPVDVAELADEEVLDDAALEYRRVTLTGTYLADEELLLEGRELRGQAGRDSFMPLELEDGTLVLVRRGWVPRELGPPPLADAVPPAGEVTVEGYLERSVPQPGFGPRNPEGELAILQIPDVARIAQQLPGPTFPMIVRLTTQDPPPIASDAVAARGLEALPAIRPQEPFDEGSHLSYALQWHSFAVLALIAYVAYWVKRLRGHDPASPPAPPSPGAGPDGTPSSRVASGQPPL